MNEIKDSSDLSKNDEDLNTTPPNPVPSPSDGSSPTGKWEMPKPVFRKTSGYLPPSYEKMAAASGLTTGESPEPAFAPVKPQAPSETPDLVEPQTSSATLNLVEPQPDLSEVLISEPELEPVLAPSAPKRSRGIAWTIFGLIFIVGFIVIFLAVIYFLILRPSGTEGVF